MKKSAYCIILACILSVMDLQAGVVPVGTIQGHVLDRDTQSPLPLTNVVLMGTPFGAVSDGEGRFSIEKVPIGGYTLRFSYLGYETLLKPDVIVKPNRISFVSAEMKMSSLEMKGVTVKGGYFAETEDQPVSAVSFSYEEIRRAPGALVDVSRIVMSLPSVAQVNDQSNNLIVRGGSPIENGFYVDGVEIPNINHFPAQGASGGPLGVLNLDFIEDVTFHAGGFSAAFGDRLSSIMDIAFREGNRKEFDGKIEMHLAGFGGSAEGPIAGGRGSWLVSARRSYFDLIAKLVDIGSTMPPHWGDYQWKAVFDVSKSHRLSFLGVWSDDHNNPDAETAEKNDMINYGRQDITERTTGIVWRALWGKSGFSNTSLSWTSSQYREDWKETGSDLPLSRNRSDEGALQFRNVNRLLLGSGRSLEFGIDAKWLFYDYDNSYSEYTDALGGAVPAMSFTAKIRADKVGAFATLSFRPFAHLKANAGFRLDRFSYSRNVTADPRASFEFDLTERSSISGSIGLFHQNLPLVLLGQNSENGKMKVPSAVHFVIGADRMLSENTRLSVEAYRKDYSNCPLDPAQPSLFLLDEVVYRGNFFNHERLTDTGKASSVGVEILLQKKLAREVYGLAGLSLFRTRYRDGFGVWRDRVYDNRFVFNIEGGYKPNRSWEFSARWIFAGGTLYTPFDAEASSELKRGVMDGNRINAAKYPEYHTLNVRFDRRFNFRSTNLIVYLSVWNATNRKNVAQYFWNVAKNEQGVINQWNLLPVVGLEYEF